MGKRLTIDDYRAVSHLTRKDAAIALSVSYAAVAKMAANHSDLKFAKKTTEESRIVEALAAYPNARNVDIAKKLNIKPAYVSTVKQRLGLSVPRGPKNPSLSAYIRPDIADWVRAEAAKSNVTIGEFVNACLVDAKWEAQQ